MPAHELALDPDVVVSGSLCEFQGWEMAARHGGEAVLPWRSEWLRARRAGLEARRSGDDLEDASLAQCLVHLQKSRPATWRDLGIAWRVLEPGGRLVLCGGNDLGITSAVKRLAREFGQMPRVLANRAHARAVLFERDRGEGPVAPEPIRIDLPMSDEPDVPRRQLGAEPGVFSARKLDVGSELLLRHLEAQKAPRRILDLGCGMGPLGLGALLRWPKAEALLLDADARAVASACANARAFGLADRCRVEWWDASEPCPDTGFDLALVNPPFHTGKAVDLAPARAMFSRLGEVLAPGKRALIVANRTLPYEAELRPLGHVEVVAQERGFKLLALKRTRSRSRALPRR
jgi:16S rRNA (guanine1207-N2)-methyltransferase